MFNILLSMFQEWTNDDDVRCASCRGKGNDCVCPEDVAGSVAVDAAPVHENPTESFRVHCELTPWASECKIYED